MTGRVIGVQEYSYDLVQGGFSIPVNHPFEGPVGIVKVSKTNVDRLLEEPIIA